MMLSVMIGMLCDGAWSRIGIMASSPGVPTGKAIVALFAGGCNAKQRLGGPQFLANTGTSANKDLKDALEDECREVVWELNGFERQQDTTVAWCLLLLTR